MIDEVHLLAYFTALLQKPKGFQLLTYLVFLGMAARREQLKHTFGHQ
jgi:hypothetical protein